MRLRERAEALRQEELRRLAPTLSETERAAVDRATRSIMRALLHGPTVALRRGDRGEVGDMLARAFARTRLRDGLDGLAARVRTLRVGTRKSALAMRQTEMVVAALRRARPEGRFEVVQISTEGDERRDASLRRSAGRASSSSGSSGRCWPGRWTWPSTPSRTCRPDWSRG